MLGFFLNVTGSLPLGLYRVVRAPVTRGAIVVVCLPAAVGALARARGYLHEGPCPSGAERLGKTVAAVAGDTVDVSAAGVRINGVLVSGSRPLDHDSRGRRLWRMWPAPAVIQPGEVFLLATRHPRSFDGRYFGPTPVEGAIVVVPVMCAR